jgi:hypothetical protein
MLPPITVTASLVLGLSLGLRSGVAMALTLASPQNDTTLQSGQVITAAVERATELGLSQVRYYWYRQGEEPVPRHLAHPVLVGTSVSDPPYGGRLEVPREAVGKYRLLAVGEIAHGRLAGRDEFDEVIVQIEPPTALTGIEFEVEKPWHLDTVGKIYEVPVVGFFADGISRRLSGPSGGSMLQSSNEAVIRPLGEGLIQVMGNGRAMLTARNRGQEGMVDIVVRTDAEANRPPIARATPDLNVKSGSTVALTALGSIDPDGDPLRYEWTQVRGNPVSLLDPNTPRATFVAPKVSAKRLLRFKLRVTDMTGPDTVKGADSLPVFVNVWIEP